ncbi:MAG: hypothetical protein NVS3B16_04160 [Vulcanimicrobiaceae bacterium]
MRRGTVLAAFGAGALALAGGGAAVVATSRGDGSLEPPSAATLHAILGRHFKPAEMRRDLDFLVATLIEVAVDPFAVVPRRSFEALRARIEATLIEPLEARTFWLRIAPLFASLDDGHISTSVDALHGAEIERGARIFPFAMTFTPGGAFVTRAQGRAMAAGSRIVAIDGIPMERLVPDLLATVSASTLEMRLSFASDRFFSYVYARFGTPKSHAVTFVEPNSTRERRATLATLTKEEVLRRNARLPARYDYRYSELAGGSVGYIDYRACRDLEAFKRFLHATFTRISAAPVRALVIDIRRNGGGDDSLNDELWQYAAGKPFEQGNTMVVKVSHRMKAALGFATYSAHYLPPSWFARDGSVIEYRLPDILTMQRPRENPLRYTGPVYLLIGAHTASSALSCAEAAKTFRLATLVGEAPGQPIETNGEVRPFYAPHTAVGAFFPTKFDIGPGRDSTRTQRIEPDVRIVTTPADVRGGRDPVLAYVLERVVRARR